MKIGTKVFTASALAVLLAISASVPARALVQQVRGPINCVVKFQGEVLDVGYIRVTASTVGSSKVVIDGVVVDTFPSGMNGTYYYPSYSSASSVVLQANLQINTFNIGCQF